MEKGLLKYSKPIRPLEVNLQYLIHKIKLIYLCPLELMFLETSALTGENVEEAFVQCARKILNKIESGKSREFTLNLCVKSLRIFSSNRILLCWSGELDPERMGSGIQYGDAALRQLRSPRRAQAESVQECGC